MNFIKKISKTRLFRISSLNSFTILIKLATGLATSKLLALFVGPTGMALMGNLRNLFASLEGIATLGFTNGIIKYIGENEQHKEELNKIITTVFLTLMGVAFVLSSLLLLFSDYLCAVVFENKTEFAIIFKVLAVVLPFVGISTLLVSIVNGLGKFNTVFISSSITTLFCFILSFFLIFNFNTLGAFLSIICVPLVSTFVILYYVPKEIQIFKRINLKEFDFAILKKFMGFSLMVLPPAILSPVFNLQIRNFLIDSVGLQQTGFWETILRISNLYMLFFGSILSIYFYPVLVKANKTSETKNVIRRYFKFIIPIFLLMAVLLYFLRFIVIKLLFANEFLPASELFFWQLLGDFLKVCGMILGILLMSQKKILDYIFIEVLALVFLYFVSIFCINSFGVEGVVLAQAIENLFYLLVLSFYFRKQLI